MSSTSNSARQSRKRKAEDNVCSDIRKFQRTVEKEASEAALEINTDRRKRYVRVLKQMLEAKRRQMEAMKELEAILDEEKEGYRSLTNRIVRFKIYAGVPVEALQMSEEDDSEFRQSNDEEAEGYEE